MKDGRDLLVGLLVVEQGFITRKQMHAEFGVWQNNAAENSFAEHLVSLTEIEAGDIEPIELEIARRLEGDSDYLRASIWRSFMTSAADQDAEVSVELEQTMSEILVAQDTSGLDLNLESSVDWLSGSLGATNIGEGFGRSGSQTKNEPPLLVETNLWTSPENEDEGARYSRTRVHSQGGLGRVWLARDHTLNREVALKEIRNDRGVTAEKVRRFMREAQITGQLEHPNIIPVYELSADSSESPYYTMRFLRGGTLSDRITTFQKTKTAGWNSLELTQLLSAFVGVCHAIAYSHSRGVIHRDLKPDNIMLGAFGEVILLDWGLAKTVDEVIGDHEETGPAVEVVGEAAVDRTQYGQIVGTVNYMAPEQASGNLRKIGPATDIYGLGGILYAILTGCAPHHRLRAESGDGSTRAILHQIASGEAPSARAADQTIPKALDAICAKAMARSTKGRYETATQLAEDVQRWLADEPVSAHQAQFRERAVRWMRRHKSWTVATAAALLLVSVISTSAALMVNRARGEAVLAQGQAEDALAKEQEALIAETKARDDAMRMLRKARQSVDRSFTGVSMVLKNYPGVQLLRVELLKQAAVDYESFAQEEGDLPELQLETARAHSRLGDVQALIGNAAESESAYLAAEAKYRKLLPLLTDDTQAAVELSDTLSTLGALQAARHDFAAARKFFKAADDLLGGIDADGEAKTESADRGMSIKLARAAVKLNAASVPHAEGDFDQAKAKVQLALNSFRELADSKDSAIHRAGLANAHRRLGKLNVDLGNYEQAIRELSRGADLYERLWDDHEELRFLEGAAECLIDTGNAARLAGDERDAVQHYASAVERYEALLEARPGVPTYREMLAILGLNVAQIRNRQARNVNAQDLAVDAFRTFDELVLSTPKDTAVPQYLLERGVAAASLATITRDMNADGAAGIDVSLQYSQQAMDDFGKLTGAFKTTVDYKRRLAASRTDRARTLSTSGTTEEDDQIQELYSLAIAMYGEILERSPADKSTQDKLASACLYYAEWLIQFEDRKADASKLLARSTGIRNQLDGSAEQLDRRAWLLCRCPDQKFRDLPRAIESAHAACLKSPENARFHCTLGLAFVANGQGEEAEKAFEIAQELRDPMAPHALELFGLAIAQAKLGDQEKAEMFLAEAQKVAEQNSPGNPDVLSLKHEAEAEIKRVFGDGS